jgi:hypothetical protein
MVMMERLMVLFLFGMISAVKGVRSFVQPQRIAPT